jgi:hypothetical protein
MKMMRVQKQHKFLVGTFAGEFNVVQTIFGMGPKPQVVKGATKGESLYGGRYVRTVTKAKMMGMPTTSEATLGYDNALKRFDMTWISSMSTQTIRSVGKLSEDGKTLTFTGHMEDPFVGKRPVRHVFTVKDQGYDFVSFDTMRTGQEFKVMEMTFTRKAAKKTDDGAIK